MDKTKIALLGDLALVGKFADYDSFKNHFKDLKKILNSCDYVIANLEHPFSNKANTHVPSSIHLKSNPKNIKMLKYLNINIVNLANNHIFDFGPSEVKKTILTLSENSIDYFGIGSKNLLIKHNSNQINLSGFCCFSTNGNFYSSKLNSFGLPPLTYSNVNRRIKINKDKNYFSLLNFHWGDEHTNYPNNFQRKLIQKLNLNDTVIHGHHSHTIQPFFEDISSSSCIYYGLGNFCFDEVCSLFVKDFSIKLNEDNKKTFIPIIEFSKNKIINIEKIGLYNDQNGLSINSLVLDELSTISNKFRKENQKTLDKIRNSQIDSTKQEKFETKNLKWILKRLNFNSITFKILTFLNRFRFRLFFLK